jgi:hypothetical protein
MKHRLGFATAFLVGLSSVAATAQTGYTWVFNRATAGLQPGDTGIYVGYGVPQTDDAQFIGSCILGMSGPFTRFQIATRPHNIPHGNTVRVAFTAPGFNQVVTGKIRTDGEMMPGVEIVLPPNDRLWQAMIAQTTLTYEVEGAGSAQLSLRGSAGPVRQFTQQCSRVR